MTIFLALIAMHAVCDYPLQGEFLARAKNRFAPVAGFPWYQALGAHAIIHGGAVGFLTGIWWLGILEAVAHFVIDYQKCAGRTGLNTDQALHIACKAAWAAVAILIVR
jgi:hypothetical protein